MSASAIQHAIDGLLGEQVAFGPERVPNAAADYRRVALALHSNAARAATELARLDSHSTEQLGAVASVPPAPAAESMTRMALQQSHASALEAVGRITSMECAAGAPVDRCRRWFSCLAMLSGWTGPRYSPLDLADVVTWLALAGQFSAEASAAQFDGALPTATHAPDGIGSRAPIYRLFTRQALIVDELSALHDSPRWAKIVGALEQRRVSGVTEGFRELADFWLNEYRSTETEPYEPERFFTFEPEPNAALAIVVLRDGLDIRLTDPKHRQFYIVARMLAGA